MDAVQPFEFDPYSSEFDVNPYPIYRYLRENAPVYYWPVHRAVVLSRYEDVDAAMRDRRLSMDYHQWERARPREESDFETIRSKGLFRLPEQDHARVRRLVSPAFTPRAIEGMRPAIQRIADEALDRGARGDTMDIVSDFASYLPLRVMSSLFSIPKEMDEQFRRFGGALVTAINPWLPPEQLAQIMEPITAGIALMREVIDARRKDAGDDLLSALIRAEEQGDKLSKDELLALVSGLLTAGSETMVHFICFSVLNLLRHPDQREILREEPELLRNALEEVLRFDSSTKCGFPRFAVEDMEIRGTKINKGQMVYALRGSALRDPVAFSDPDTFNIRRDVSRSVAFGAGPHYCMGASLARLEGQVAIGALLTRFPDLELAGEPTFARSLMVRRMSSLPVRLRPPR